MDRIAVNQIPFEPCALTDKQEWLALRCELWPHLSISEHREEIERLIKDKNRFAAFLCRSQSGIAVGFAETSLRTDYVNGCGAGPVAYIEGIYVRSEHRGKGAARALCTAIEN